MRNVSSARFTWLGVRIAAVALGVSSLGATPPARETTDVSVSSRGFRPATLTARKGEPLRLRLNPTDHEHCFAIDELRVEKRVVPGRATSVELTAGEAGRFAYYCCLETGAPAERERGTLVVTE